MHPLKAAAAAIVVLALAGACSSAQSSQPPAPAAAIASIAPPSASARPAYSPAAASAASSLVLHLLSDFRANPNLAQGGTVKWTPNAMAVAANVPFQIVMKVPNDATHNLWIVTPAQLDKDRAAIVDQSATALFKSGDQTSGTKTYNIAALKAGTYLFVCTYHLEFMTGTLTVH